MSKKIKFTLVELLTVIAIIAVLASLVLATISMVKLRLKKLQARTDIAQIILAVQNYEAEYHVPPCGYQTAGDAVWYDIADKEKEDAKNYDITMQILANANISGTGQNGVSAGANDSGITVANAKGAGNVRSKSFLTVPHNFAAEGFRDPFYNPKSRPGDSVGTRYAIAIDLDSNGTITLPGGEIINGKIAVWSFGPDGDNDWGAGSGSSDGNRNDDIASWRDN